VQDDLLARLGAALEGRYRIERELGRGGMATVFLARDLRHDRDVAIKVLLPHLAAALSPDRFLQEIHIAAQLQHPLILPLFDSGRADDLYYYVMPRIVGESLRQRLQREKRLPLDEAVRIGKEIGEALQYAHGQGVVHRDIKPENIMLTGGHPLVADFGIARALTVTDDARLTSTGVRFGTPLYMSPEQALGDPGLDARSDVYSLGCVVYEMIAGTTPYTGANLHAILSGHVLGTPPSLSTQRLGVPASVQAAVETALARDPADRFQSAAEFGRALSDPAWSGHRSRGGPWRWPGVGSATPLRAGIAVGIAGAIAAGVWALRSEVNAPPALDPNLVSVAPFDALGPGLGLWREGLMDMLSRNLNGAGPLRVVSPTVVARSWSGRADVASAGQVGRQNGAGLSVVGSIVSAGADSVRLAVTVVDVAAAEPLGDVEYAGPVSRMDVAVDSLTVGLLAALGRSRPIGAVHLGTPGSKSLPALKAYLQGEQYFRRADWDAAQRDFERAASLDPTFALAFYRIFETRFYKGTGIDSLMWSYALRAGQLNHGLAARESLMIAADSVLATVTDAPALDPEVARRRARVFGILELANRRFPDDAEVWYQLGRARNRVGYLAGIQPEQALQALDRAIAIDSSFAPAYVEAFSFSTIARGPEATRRYLQGYLALAPKGALADVARLALDLMDPARARSPAVAAVLDTASARMLYHTMSIFEYAGDSGETYVRLGRRLVERAHDPSLAADTALPRRSLGFGLAFRGHMAEALRVLGTDRLYLLGQIAALGAMPADSAGAVFDPLLRAVPAPLAGLVFALPWWAKQKNLPALDRARGIGERQAERVPTARFLAAAAAAWRTLAAGDSAAALTAFLALPDLPNFEGIGDWERYTAIRLLNDRGRFQEALIRLDREIPSTAFPWDVVLLLERARAEEGLGHRSRAARTYARVADLWARADPFLQPTVAAARAASARLRGTDSS
jgi:eukaryotic-like serine/threonine-protein kinase